MVSAHYGAAGHFLSYCFVKVFMYVGERCDRYMFFPVDGTNTFLGHFMFLRVYFGSQARVFELFALLISLIFWDLGQKPLLLPQ